MGAWRFGGAGVEFTPFGPLSESVERALGRDAEALLRFLGRLSAAPEGGSPEAGSPAPVLCRPGRQSSPTGSSSSAGPASARAAASSAASW